MPIFTHREQRPNHLFRYGPWHLVRHLRNEQHGHFAAVVNPAVRRRSLVVYGTIAAIGIIVVFVLLVVFSIHPLSTARSDLNSARSLIGNDLHNKSLLTTASGRADLLGDIGEV